jgi:hypothetical protein
VRRTFWCVLRLLLLGCLVLGLPAGTVRAQSEAAAASDPQLRAAVEAYEAGRLDDARMLFEQVHARAPTARTLRGLGVIAFRQGRFAQATSLLEASLGSQERPLTPELRRGVELVLADARAQLARIELRALDPQAHVHVDGAKPAYDAGGALLLGPGAHTLVVSRPGYLERRHELALQAGGQLSLDASLTPLPMPGASRVTTPTTSSDSEAVSTNVGTRTRSPPVHSLRRRRLRRAAYVLLAVGASALVTSLAATAAGIRRVRHLEDECRALPDGQCTLEEAEAKHRAENLDLLSGLAIGGAAVGGTSAVTGLVLRLTIGGAEPAQTMRGHHAPMLQIRGFF